MKYLNNTLHSCWMRKIILVILIGNLFALSACKKYLDAKSDKKLVTPNSLRDADAILDNYAVNNAFYPYGSAVSDDDFYLIDTYFGGLNAEHQKRHIWDIDAQLNDFDWDYLYKVVLAANMVIELTNSLHVDNQNANDWNRIRGGALFFRAYAFYHLAQYYAEPYEKTSASQKLGIPLKLTSDVNERIFRPSLHMTWNQIVEDFKKASEILPVTTSPISRPSRQAAFAALARSHIMMDEYTLAEQYADSCLSLNNQLLNYNELDSNSSNPFTRFNKEVIFPSVMQGTGMLNTTNWRVDSVLYESYNTNDLRRVLYYKNNGGGTYGFKGNYDGGTGSARFNGIALDEVYFIKAECAARLDKTNVAMDWLNALLSTRWKNGTFTPYSANSSNEALMITLAERRKGLVLRGTRWFDLRRLNKDPKLAKTLNRKYNGQIYQLAPNDPKYTFFIPQVVIDLSQLEQNIR